MPVLGQSLLPCHDRLNEGHLAPKHQLRAAGEVMRLSLGGKLLAGLCHFSAVCAWASYFPSLVLYFQGCTVSMAAVRCCEDYVGLHA